MDIVERLREGFPTNYELDAADEIERLREQIVFERASLRSALDELRKQDGDIERLQKHIELLGEEIYLLNSNQPGGDKPSENS
jgi:hypothetical protein